MIKAVIFDLDGVLVTTDELHYQAWKQLAEEEGITGFMREDNLRQRGVSRMASLEVVLEKADRQYSDKEKAAHSFELTPRKETVLRIDYKVSGIGSNSCGPELLPKYRFDEKNFKYTFQVSAAKLEKENF